MDSEKLKRLRRAAYDRQDARCYWCRVPMVYKTGKNAHLVWNRPDVCTADHLIRVADGGRTNSKNIVAACRKCNNSRHYSAYGDVLLLAEQELVDA